MMKSFFIAIFIFLVLPAIGYSQQYPMLHYTLDNGLPSNTVYDVYKDSHGFLWFATDKGVARYNGLKFDVFTTENGLPDNEIFFFREDYSKRLWLSTYNGELCYYKNGVFHTANNTPFLRLPSKNAQILQINIGQDSTVTVYYPRGKFVNIRNEKCSIYDLNIIIKDVDVIQRLIRISTLSDGTFEIIDEDKRVVIDPDYKIRSLAYYPDRKIYRGSNGGGQHYLYLPDTLYDQYLKPIFPFGKELSALSHKIFLKKNFHRVFIDQGNVFVATYYGLYINRDIVTLKGQKISSVACDKAGNYWFSSLDNGVFIFNRNFLHQKQYDGNYKNAVKYASVNNGSLFFTLDNDNFYTVHSDSISCLFNYVKCKPNKAISVDNPICYIDHDRYYNFYNYDNLIIDHINSPKPDIEFPKSDLGYGDSHFFPKEITTDASRIFVRLPEKIAYSDFSLFSPGNSKEHVFNNISGSGNQRIFAFAKAGDNTIWYSTLNNVYKIVGTNAIVQPQFKNNTFKWFNIYDNYLVGVTQENKILVCNHYNGDIQIDSVIGQKSIWIKSFRLDSDHILIRTSDNYRVLTLLRSQQKPVFSVRRLEDPFIPLDPEAICTSDSACFFFKKGAITTLPIKEFFLTDTPPTVTFTALKTKDTILDISTTQLELPYNNAQSLTLYFSVLSFSSKNVSLEYSISKDTTHQWKQIANEGLNIFSLGYGTFKMDLRAKTLSGQVSDTATFTLIILKPFWARWWFIILCALITLCAVSFIIFYWIKRILLKREAAHKSKMNSLKSEYKVLNALMNPHFVFNTLNNVQSLVNKDNKLASNEYLRIFADLIRQNMHNLSFELIPLQKELDLVSNYLKIEKLRFKEWFNYSINIDEEVDAFEVMIPPLLIQPLVENSIKHGLLPLQSVNGVITINIYEKENRTIIEVVDNGIGIESSLKNEDKLHESYGLENIKKRIMQLSALYSLNITFEIKEIKDDWTNTTGTIAIICIQNNH